MQIARNVFHTFPSAPSALGTAQLVDPSKEQILHAVCQHLDVSDPGSPGRVLADLLATRPAWIPRMANGQIDWWSVAMLTCHFSKLPPTGQQEMLGEIAKLPSLDAPGAKHGRLSWETDKSCDLSITQYEKPPPTTCPTKGGGGGWIVPILTVGAVAGVVWLATREKIGPAMGGVRENPYKGYWLEIDRGRGWEKGLYHYSRSRLEKRAAFYREEFGWKTRIVGVPDGGAWGTAIGEVPRKRAVGNPLSAILHTLGFVRV